MCTHRRRWRQCRQSTHPTFYSLLTASRMGPQYSIWLVSFAVSYFCRYCVLFLWHIIGDLKLHKSCHWYHQEERAAWSGINECLSSCYVQLPRRVVYHCELYIFWSIWHRHFDSSLVSSLLRFTKLRNVLPNSVRRYTDWLVDCIKRNRIFLTLSRNHFGAS